MRWWIYFCSVLIVGQAADAQNGIANINESAVTSLPSPSPTCESYDGTKVRFTELAPIIPQIARLKRNEFETSAEFEDRKRATLSRLPKTVVVRSVTSQAYEYDADAGIPSLTFFTARVQRTGVGLLRMPCPKSPRSARRVRGSAFYLRNSASVCCAPRCRMRILGLGYL